MSQAITDLLATLDDTPHTPDDDIDEQLVNDFLELSNHNGLSQDSPILF